MEERRKKCLGVEELDVEEIEKRCRKNLEIFFQQ